MKKIILTLTFFLVGIILFGQPHVKSTGYIERQDFWIETKDLPVGDSRKRIPTTTEERIYDNGFYDKNGDIRISYAHFVANGRVFMLSYEPLSERIPMDVPEHLKNRTIFESEIFLYSKELSKPKSEWEVASVKKIAGNYEPHNILICKHIAGIGYTDADWYMYEERYNTDIGKVVKLNDGSVEITVGS